MATLTTIGEKLPDWNWLYVYTNGSATVADTSAGVYSKHSALTEIAKREEQNVIFIDFSGHYQGYFFS